MSDESILSLQFTIPCTNHRNHDIRNRIHRVLRILHIHDRNTEASLDTIQIHT